jgi:hypothetical protein
MMVRATAPARTIASIVRRQSPTRSVTMVVVTVPRSLIPAVVAAAIVCVVLPHRVSGQDTLSAPALASSATAVLERLDELERLLEAQRDAIVRQRAEIDGLRAQLRGDWSFLHASAFQPQVSAPSPGPAQVAVHAPDLPQRFVARGEFPGSIEIPGTDTAFKTRLAAKHARRSCTRSGRSGKTIGSSPRRFQSAMNVRARPHVSSTPRRRPG